jgi:lipoyl(octanoyl) transferase
MPSDGRAGAARTLQLRRLGLCDYAWTWQAMRRFTDERGADTEDALWLVEHPPVFTLGQAGRPEHVLNPGDIPVVQTDRGGQVTYHGPGQIIAYLMLDLRRAGIGVKRLVNLLEQAVIDVLADAGIAAASRPDAPGVYVNRAKIASVGLRVRRACSYHGIALNVDLDLAPFQRINPCGYAGLQVIRLVDLVPGAEPTGVGEQLAEAIAAALGLGLVRSSSSARQATVQPSRVAVIEIRRLRLRQRQRQRQTGNCLGLHP